MANSLYDKGREGFLGGDISWRDNNIKGVMVHEGSGGTPYTPNLATDQFLSDIPSGARISTSGNFTTKTITAGVADADDVTHSAVTGAVSVDSYVIYQDTGTAGTSRLIARLDTLTGFPFTPSGGDEQVQWDNGANKIFKL